MEMHIIAYVYHWGYSDLISLSPKERKVWVKMILDQKEAEKEGYEDNS